jgi:hypothetical protein
MKIKPHKISPLKRAEEEIHAARLWRAKEILSGYIACCGYSQEAFAAYGRLLIRMGDTKEAGKFLFLSGLADKEEEKVVQLYLGTVQGKPFDWIYSQFPIAGRKAMLADYPERLRRELKSLGFPDDFKKYHPASLEPKTNKWKTWFATLVGFSVLIVFIAGFLHGCEIIGRWLVGK